MSTALLFDLEGTLVQTQWERREHVLEFRRETRRKLIELGIPPRILEGVERSTVMRNKALEYVESNFKKADVEKYRQEMEKFLRLYELDAAENSKLFPETISTLEELKKLRVRMGLVTNTSREAVNIVFRNHGLESYFDVVITRERVRRIKPDSEGVLLCVKELGALGFFMVGDAFLDMEAAKNANGTSIIVKRNAEDELDFHPDYLIRSLNEVAPIVTATARNSGKSVESHV